MPETDLVCSQDEKEASEAEESGQWGRVEDREDLEGYGEEFCLKF